MKTFGINQAITTALATIFIIVGSISFVASSGAEVIYEDIKILPDDGVFNDLFGGSMSLDAGVVAVGKSHDGINGYASGSAYLFNTTTGDQIAKIVPFDGDELDNFGYALAMGSGVLAVGALFDDDAGSDSGSVYLYNSSTGSYISKLTASDGKSNAYFGVSVAIDNGTLAIGAYKDWGTNDSGSGAAYLFDTESGLETFKLQPNDGAIEDFFGHSIDVDNNIVVVGSPYDDDNGNRSGSVYLFNATTGAQISKLLPNDGGTGDRFGGSVAIDNGVVVVGAYNDDDQGSNCGSAYLFHADTGVQFAKILPANVYSNEVFGMAVGIDNGVVIVGAKLNEGIGTDSGAAYLFDASTGEEMDTLVPGDGELNDQFGFSVAINNGVIAVGAVGDDDNGSGSGSGYIFDIGGASTPVMPDAYTGLTLMPNHPNPFNPCTTISYSLENDAQVELAVFSARGIKVRTLVSGWQTAGANHAVMWDGKDDQGQLQSSGVYFARLASKGMEDLQKMVLLK